VKEKDDSSKTLIIIERNLDKLRKMIPDISIDNILGSLFTFIYVDVYDLEPSFILNSPEKVPMS
jgi:hypothetical protein